MLCIPVLSLFLFHCCVVFHYVDVPWRIHAFSCWWAFGLFPVQGYNELSRTCPLVHICPVIHKGKIIEKATLGSVWCQVEIDRNVPHITYFRVFLPGWRFKGIAAALLHVEALLLLLWEMFFCTAPVNQKSMLSVQMWRQLPWDPVPCGGVTGCCHPPSGHSVLLPRDFVVLLLEWLLALSGQGPQV